MLSLFRSRTRLWSTVTDRIPDRRTGPASKRGAADLGPPDLRETEPTDPGGRSQLDQELERIGQDAGQLDDEASRVGAVNDPMVVGERQGKHQPLDDFAVDELERFLRPRHAEDGRLGIVDDGR